MSDPAILSQLRENVRIACKLLQDAFRDNLWGPNQLGNLSSLVEIVETLIAEFAKGNAAQVLP